jgi:hypothetical protein
MEAQGKGAERSFDHLAIIYTKRSLFIAVIRMKMWWRMIIVIHGNNDSEEAG